MLRFRSNCSVSDVLPAWLLEVISVTPAIRPNWRSSGVATDEAMISGLAPGRLACTWIVGNSTCGNGATGRKLYAMAPASSSAKVSSEVAIGLSTNGAEMFMFVATNRRQFPLASVRCCFRFGGIADPVASESPGEPIKRQIHNRRGVKCEHLTDQQAADDADAERLAQFRTRTRSQRERQAAQQGRHRRHHDRAKPQQACLINRIFRRLPFFALRVEREVDHHDCVFLYDANKQDDADQCNHAEITP